MSGSEDGEKPKATLDTTGPVTTDMQTIQLLEETLLVAKRTSSAAGFGYRC